MLVALLALSLCQECEELSNQVLNTRSVFETVKNNCFIVTNCLFDRCSCDNELGGAMLLQLNPELADVTIVGTTFSNCHSGNQSGAVHFVGKTFTTQEVCVFGCTAPIAAGLTIEGHAHHSCTLNYTTITECVAETYGNIGRYATFLLRYTNMSFNKAHNSASAFFFDTSLFFDGTGTTLCGNRDGVDITWIESSVQAWFNWRNSNFYNHSLGEVYLLEFCTSMIFWDCVFQDCGQYLINVDSGLAIHLYRCVLDTVPVMNGTYVTWMPGMNDHYNMTTATLLIPGVNTGGCHWDDPGPTIPSPTNPPTSGPTDVPTRSPPTKIPHPDEGGSLSKGVVAAIGVVCFAVGTLAVLTVWYGVKRCSRVPENVDSRPLTSYTVDKE